MRPAKTRQGGFTYLLVLLLVLATTVAAAAVGTIWSTAAQREKERDLLAVGEEFRNAIASYVRAGTGNARPYPRALQDLVLDVRQPGVRRYLRRVHVDPMTGRAEWGLVTAPDGGIAGVHSLSERKPLKRTGFAEGQRDFESAERYADWLFVYRSPVAPSRAASAPGR